MRECLLHVRLLLQVRDRTLELAKKTRLKGSIAAIGRCVSKKRQQEAPV